MDGENKWRARGALDVLPSEDTGDTNASSLAFVSAPAFLLGGAAAVSLLAAIAWFAASDSTGGAALAVLMAAVAASAIIALVGRFGVSPVWPILGFVTAIVLLFLVAYAACQPEPARPSGYMM